MKGGDEPIYSPFLPSCWLKCRDSARAEAAITGMRSKLVKQSTAQWSSKICKPRGLADLRVSTISPRLGESGASKRRRGRKVEAQHWPPQRRTVSCLMGKVSGFLFAKFPPIKHCLRCSPPKVANQLSPALHNQMPFFFASARPPTCTFSL